jgi:SAM-dependent methyltransferase
MKKDYVVISDEQTTINEIAFVEDFWTRRWSKRTGLPKTNSVAKRIEYRLMRPFLQRLPVGGHILDGGCGMGEWTVFLTNQGFQVLGLDISKQTIDRLKELLPKYQFVHGDIRKTEFADASFDAYFSWGTFEHFENGLGECMKEAYRILKPEGFLVVSVPYQNWRHILRDARAWHKWDENYDFRQGDPMRFYQWRLTKPELQRELEIHGFKCLIVEAIHKKEGLHRAIVHDLGVRKDSRWHKPIYKVLYPFCPKNGVCHMILGIGQKQ